MFIFVLKGPANRGEGLSQRKDIGGDQQIRIVGSDRVPVDTVGSYRDLWDKIGACKCDTFDGNATQDDSPDHPVFLINATRIEEALKFLSLVIRGDRCRQSHPEPFRASEVDCL
jgi:hypothetical protein